MFPTLPAQEGPSIPEDFALRLKLARVARGLAQKELAAKLRVQPQTIWNWENGRATPVPDHKADLARFFGASLFSEDTGNSAIIRAGTPDHTEATPLRGQSQAETRRHTLPNHPELREEWYKLQYELARGGADDAGIESAKRLLASDAAVDLYGRYGSGSTEEMTKALHMLGDAIKSILGSADPEGRSDQPRSTPRGGRHARTD